MGTCSRQHARPGGRENFALLTTLALIIVGIFKARSLHPSSNTPSLDPSFLAHCKSLLAPQPTTYTSRLARLTSALSGDGTLGSSASPAVWVAEPGASVEYFLGAFSSRDWWLSERPFLVAVTPSAANPGNPNITLLTPEFERLRAQLIPLPEQIRPYISWLAWQENESPYELLVRHVGSLSAFVVDGESRSFIATGVQKAAKGIAIDGDAEAASTLSFIPKIQDAIALIRERKDEREIGLLRCANQASLSFGSEPTPLTAQMTLHAIRNLRSLMRIGISESATSRILKEEMAKTGLIGGEGLVLFGEDAALPHGSGTDRKLGREDLILIDAGGKWGGYVSDITRTFALPKSVIPQKHLDVWEIVRQAQYAPFDLIKASNSSLPPKLAELDVAARSVITSQMSTLGHSTDEATLSHSPDFSVFTHRLGHGIGLQGHEAPYLVQGPLGDKTVQSGHVFSLEPGVYVPAGHAKYGVDGVGVRLEDCFVVIEDSEGRLGGEWLSGPVEKWGDV